MEFLTGIRGSSLPPGWYPRDESEARKMVREWTVGLGQGSALAAVSPHAGWAFSGRLAALAVNSLKAADTIVISGGHLHASSPMLFAPEKGFETPSGVIEADREFLEAILNELKEIGVPAPQPDRGSDNSVEVLLPMIAILHPKARVLWFRSPPRGDSKTLGEVIGRVADTMGKSVACIGSTDLTHYGPAYGFTPAGMGDKAEKWVRNTNDKGFIAELLEMNCEKAISNALKKNSACSPGAAATAMGFALEAGASESRLLGYSTSLDVHKADSFVGYAAVAFLKD